MNKDKVNYLVTQSFTNRRRWASFWIFFCVFFLASNVWELFVMPTAFAGVFAVLWAFLLMLRIKEAKDIEVEANMMDK